MKKILLVLKAEIVKQQQHDYHSSFIYISLLLWPVLGFFEVYYTYKPFELTGYLGISDHRELLAFLGTGCMAYTCFWSMVQNAWDMSNQERRGGTLEMAFLSPANRLAMLYGRALGALAQETWMFSCFCLFILLYTDTIRLENLFLLPVVFLLLLGSSTIWGGMMNAVCLFSRDASMVMNLFDTPMVLFSGSRIPRSCFPGWAQVISLLFPLTYCINLVRFVLGVKGGGQDWGRNLAELAVCLLAMVLITVVLICRVEKHNRKTGELQFY